MQRPRILTVTRRHKRKGLWVNYTGELHLDLLLKLGALPFMVSVVADTLDYVDMYKEEMQGLLLVEGEDVHPLHYNGSPKNIDPEQKPHIIKDTVEMILCKHALDNKIPILGICRGSHILNVVAGGTLYTDVKKEMPSELNHVNHDNYYGYRHSVSIVSHTPLHTWYRKSSIDVNSYHHAGVNQLAPRFKTTAYADDSLIEAYYDPHAAFTVGLQFHPERMLGDYEGNLRVWEEFVKAVKENQKKILHQ